MVQQSGAQADNNKLATPIVSVIIATYNAGKVLKGAIESFVTHASQNNELIIIDGGSTDNTLSIINEFSQHISTRVSEPDSGIYDALNKGAKLAKGKWLFFMGADDRLLQGFTTMEALLKRPDTIYYGTVQSNGPLFLGEFSKYRLAKYCMNHQTIFYPAIVFKKYQYDLRYKVLADYAMNIRCWGDNTLKKKYYPIEVAFYNAQGFSSVTADEVFLKDKQSLIKKYMDWFTYQRFVFKRNKEKDRPNSLFNAVNPEG